MMMFSNCSIQKRIEINSVCIYFDLYLSMREKIRKFGLLFGLFFDFFARNQCFFIRKINNVKKQFLVYKNLKNALENSFCEHFCFFYYDTVIKNIGVCPSEN